MRPAVGLSCGQPGRGSIGVRSPLSLSGRIRAQLSLPSSLSYVIACHWDLLRGRGLVVLWGQRLFPGLSLCVDTGRKAGVAWADGKFRQEASAV